jgi:hypothetical protein
VGAPAHAFLFLPSLPRPELCDLDHTITRSPHHQMTSCFSMFIRHSLFVSTSE